MHDPKSYQQVNTVQTQDVEKTLKEFPTQWKASNARILDIGCGDGSVTMNIWQKYLPDNFMEIVGCDKSQVCVDFAKEHYESERVKFVKLDIEHTVPSELRGSFDHVISSYTFHWVQAQKIAFSNIFDMLVEGGNCLLIFLGYVDVYEYYRKLSQTPKWSENLKDIESKFVSPYHGSQDPEKEITKLMQKIGFRDIKIEVHHNKFDFDNGVDGFNMMMKSFNPFDSLKDKWDDFMDDYVKLNPSAGTYVYSLLVVYGVK